MKFMKKQKRTNMSLIPVDWKIEIPDRPGLKPIYNYPACHSLGQAFNAQFTIKIHLGDSNSETWHASHQKKVCIEIERFCSVQPLQIHGSLSLHVTQTRRRIGFKAFAYEYKEKEKSFTTFMNFYRNSKPFSRMFSDLRLIGHISVDSPDSKEEACKDSPCPGIFALCVPAKTHDSFMQLAGNYEQMLDDPSFSDVTFKCGGESITAHKSVLALRSSYFKVMFNGRWKEANSNEVEIKEIDPEALRALLKYIYCNKFDNTNMSDTLACNLLVAAHLYDLPALKELCVAYLISVLSLDNVCRVLAAAFLRDENLKVNAYDFIFQNAETVLKTDEYKSLLNVYPDLSTEILLRISSTKTANQSETFE